MGCGSPRYSERSPSLIITLLQIYSILSVNGEHRLCVRLHGQHSDTANAERGVQHQLLGIYRDLYTEGECRIRQRIPSQFILLL